LLALSCLSAPTVIDLTTANISSGILNSQELALVDEIIELAQQSDRKEYYFDKLNSLLNTPETSDDNLNYKNQRRLEESIKLLEEEYEFIIKTQGQPALEAYLSREERHRQSLSDKLKVYQPRKNRAYLYIANDNPNDLVIHIKVSLNTNSTIKSNILFIEDGIEKHLSARGYTVDLQFVDRCGDDVFQIKADPNEWPDSGNWIGSHYTLAHELLHLTGLPDEYDMIEAHSTNKYMSIRDRLYWFLYYMKRDTPADAKFGIMSNQSFKPLNRHMCKSVGLGDDCVKARQNSK